MQRVTMGMGLVLGALRTALVAVAGAGAFVAFGSMANYLVASVGVQLGVAAAMGLVTAAVAHRVLAISEVVRILGRAPGHRGRA